jgi:serine protease AprX
MERIKYGRGVKKSSACIFILFFFLLCRGRLLSARPIEKDTSPMPEQRSTLEGGSMYFTDESPDDGALGSGPSDRSFFSAVASQKITTSLSQLVSQMPPGELVRVIIVFRDQPYGEKRSEALLMHLQESRQLRALGEECRIPECKEDRLMKRQQRELRNRINYEAYRMTGDAVKPQQEGLARRIEALGGSVTHRYMILNSLSAIVPAGNIDALATFDEISAIYEDIPMEPNLNVSTKAIFCNSWGNTKLLDGALNVGILDSGIDESNPALHGKNFVNQVFHATALTDGCYSDNSSSFDDLNGHGTHVSGIVMSQGSGQCSECIGVAPGVNKTFNLKAAFQCGGEASMYPSDAMAAVEWAESQQDPPDVYNLSYGGATSDDDDAFARFWDAVVSSNSKPVALSVGNSGPNNNQISSPAISYNALTVANMNDRNTSYRSDDIISPSSSRGPTLSGRKKPDIAAPGTRINSTYNFWELGNDFIEMTGTSMAAPHIAGAYLLLQDHMGTGEAEDLAQKALLINSADSWTDSGPVDGTYWNKTYGWGYVNLNKAYANRDNTVIDSLSVADRYHLYKGHMGAFDKATAVWHRRVTFDGGVYPDTWYALTNIDLFLRGESDNALLAQSISTIDNVEQVSAPSDKDVVVEVKIAGPITGADSEAVGLAFDGAFSRGIWDSRFLVGAQPFVCPAETFVLEQPVMNYGNIISHNHSVSVFVPQRWILNSVNPQTISSILPNRRSSAAWSITSPSAGNGTFSVTGNSNSYGETLLVPGTAFHISVKSPSFSDVPCNHPFYGWIEKIKKQGITSGCSANLYCPDSLVTRKEMAVFLVRAMGESPSPVSYNAYFDDIANDSAAPYINRIRELGITAGCGTRKYCPESAITRGQMAVFIFRAKGWTLYAPNTATFSDVQPSHPFSGYIERLWREGITSGCSSVLYCPDYFITRGQIAVFVSKAFFR